MTWDQFLNATYYVTQLHIQAHFERMHTRKELFAWHATHIYKAMCGADVSVDELMGLRGEKIDLINDPFALDKLADLAERGGNG